MADPERLYILDGTALLYRAHFAMINNPLMTSSGQVTSGIFGFISALVRLLQEESPDHLAIVFDDRAKTFRHQIYTDYKATREKMPDELVSQIEPLDEVLEALNVPIFRIPGYEADDVMGTLATQAEAKGWHTYLVTGDKDMMQLVSERTFVYSPGRARNPATVYDSEKVKERWGVPPEKMIDLLGLMGDSSDNVPGVQGVGEKTALKLILEYGSLEEAIGHADEVANKRVREGLRSGRELALLSKELVTIDCQVPLEIDLDHLTIDKIDPLAAAEQLQELEIKAIVPDLLRLGTETGDLEGDQPEKSYELVTTQDELNALIRKLTQAEWISFDVESTSTDPLQAEIVGLSFSVEAHHGWYVPVQYPERDKEALALDTILEHLRPILEDGKRPIIGQNIKYDALLMLCYGVSVKGIIFDTMIAAHLVDPEASSYKLDTLSQRYLNYRMVPIEELIGKRGKGQLSMADVPVQQIMYYAAEDADVVGILYPILKEKLEADDLHATNQEIEVPLIPVLVTMEENGVFLDLPLLEEMSTDMGKQLQELEKDIYEAAGTEFNINSPQQLGVILFDQLGLKQIRKRSTDVTVLEMLKDQHPLPRLILDYRQVKKLQSTYVDAFPALVHPETGRVHTSFSQTVAATGRLSSSNPNFQNIPIRTELGREIRRAFRSQEQGWSIFSADYSQIELRIMAHLAKEKALIEAFREGQDIHALTAATVFDVAPEFVTPDMRRTAKVVNFGIMYGAGPFRMSQELDISIQEGRELINRYFNTYPGIRKFIDDLLAQARADGFVSTLLGRRRQVPHLKSDNQRLRSAEERIAVNMPIQGTAAELIKIAMIRIHRRLLEEDFKAVMILQIHDELLFEAPEDEVDRLRDMVTSEMESAMELDVPLKVDSGVGRSWYEAH
ncbi:MAG: DNA polymerase I [Fidelibacterota bacterium]|nr:MAG: DNA polymerase I [Candidatus Neomarinimicrobiota bacterium]